MNKLFAPTMAASLAFILTASANAAPVKQVEIVGPAMLPVDVVNTVGVEIVGPAMLPVDVANTVEVEIVGPAMIPVDVTNKVQTLDPRYLPKEIIDTMISADGQPGMIDVAQVIQEIVVLPSPNEFAAAACRVHVSLDGVAIAHGSWNGDQYGSFPLSLPGPIDVEAQAELVAQLTPLGVDGKCSADLVVLGTLIEPIQ
ncbi:hypothetical protein ACFL3A_04480 [Pseudomonadota bacterium]